MSRIRDNKITLNCTDEQKIELLNRAKQNNQSIGNYLRTLLGWSIEKQGQRKDIKLNPNRITTS